MSPKSQDDPSPYDPARMRRVLLEVVERGGFGKPAPEGRARGLAMHHTFGSYCAHVVEVSVAPGSNGQKRVTIHKVVSVGDVGQPVNLSMLEAQMQGGIIDGIGAAFYGEVPIANGRATSRNFGDYRLIRMREAPLAIETHFIPERFAANRLRRAAAAPDRAGSRERDRRIDRRTHKDDAVHEGRFCSWLTTDHGGTEARRAFQNALLLCGTGL